MPTVFPQPVSKPRDAVNANDVTRDGDSRLAAERKRGNLAFRKRTRAGALWVPRDRRV
jgi:hypothetical protein